MIGIVESDADDLARRRHRRSEPDTRRHDGKGREVRCRKRREPIGIESIACPIRNPVRDVPDMALSIDGAGPFLSRVAKAHELHDSTPLLAAAATTSISTRASSASLATCTVVRAG